MMRWPDDGHDVCCGVDRKARVHESGRSLVCLENPSFVGTLMPAQLRDGIRKLRADVPTLRFHLDGARLWAAAIASGQSLAELCAEFDTVTLCLSKGLGAPMGGVLVGSEATIALARQFRKVYGGGLRQAGFMAAAGLFAIEHQWQRLSDDFAAAKLLEEGLVALGFEMAVRRDVNLVVADGTKIGVSFDDLVQPLAQRGILIKAKGARCRFYTHLQTGREQVERLLEALREMLAKP
jgi:threonine aldolase